MGIALITGSAGLIGSESVRYFSSKGMDVVGIDNNMRQQFFGKAASTRWNLDQLKNQVLGYRHYDVDIRDIKAMESIFSEYNNDIKLIIHAAAQPSHDWAAQDPLTDFTVNANGTLNLLELSFKYCRDAVFIFTSTNKVYGDQPNTLPLVEHDTRWEIDVSHRFYENGIDESMSIDKSTHSLFGASKVSADILVQEYGRYFGMHTACFRGGCLTGPMHSGTQLHGFLSYLMECVITGREYVVFGYNGKQVRDNIHSYDLIRMFCHFYRNPRCGEVYNVGGSRFSNCSMLEAIQICEEIADKKLNFRLSGESRIGDHIWYISDISKFRDHYPDWEYQYSLREIMADIYKSLAKRKIS